MPIKFIIIFLERTSRSPSGDMLYLYLIIHLVIKFMRSLEIIFSFLSLGQTSFRICVLGRLHFAGALLYKPMANLFFVQVFVWRSGLEIFYL